MKNRTKYLNQRRKNSLSQDDEIFSDQRSETTETIQTKSSYGEILFEDF